MARVALTGATGALGGQVATSLAPRVQGTDVELVLLARDPQRLPRIEGAEVRAFGGYGDRVSVAQSLRDVDTLFFVSGAEAADRLEQHRAFVRTAIAAGVRHIVYTSFYAASPTATFTLGRTHFDTEDLIRSGGVDFTFLRDNFYLDLLPLLVDEEGVIRGPAGDGRVSAVARADVAAVATEVLADPAQHVGATYHLTGREALTLAEAASIIGDHEGREVRFVDETVAEAYGSRARFEPEEWQADAWVSTYTAIGTGELAPVTDDVRRVAGREPLTLAELLES